MIDRDKLRALAQAATPGEWRHGEYERYNVFVNVPRGEWLGHERVLLRMNTHFEYIEDAAFIAAANPQAVLALLDDVERLTRERDTAQANYRFMVERAADEKLDGYRELGDRAAQAENERDTARSLADVRGNEVARLTEELDALRRPSNAAFREAMYELEQSRARHKMCQDSLASACDERDKLRALLGEALGLVAGAIDIGHGAYDAHEQAQADVLDAARERLAKEGGIE